LVVAHKAIENFLVVVCVAAREESPVSGTSSSVKGEQSSAMKRRIIKEGHIIITYDIPLQSRFGKTN